jgi:hypothetical protein
MSSNKVGPALVEAASHGHVGVIEVLLDAGANIGSSQGDHGTTLMVAYSGGRLSVAQMLVAQA